MSDPRSAGRAPPARDRAVTQLLERVDARLERVEAQLADNKGQLVNVQLGLVQLDRSVTADIQEARRDLGDLRDALQDHRTQTAREGGATEARLERLETSFPAAAGAAAAAVVQPAADQAARKIITPWQKWALGGAAALALMAEVIGNGPKVARAVDRFWSGLVGYEDKAETPKAKGESKAEATK